MYDRFNSVGECYECVRGLCGSCLGGECNCTHVFLVEAETFTPTIIEVGFNDSSNSDQTELLQRAPEQRVRSQKPNEHVEDPESTGRKRDARLFPLDPTKPCEWCKSNSQQKHLHFPDTDPLNNEPQNVHRVCKQCHSDAQ